MKNRNNHSQAIKEYLRAVKRGATCSPARSAKILNQLETDILLYEEENGPVDASSLALRFGSPEDIARSMMNETDTKEINHFLRWGRRIALAALIIAVLAAIVAIGFQTANYIHQEKYRNGYYVEEVYTASEYEEIKDELHEGVVQVF